MRFWLMAGLLLACEGGKTPNESDVFSDADGDGVDLSVDCDDNNAAVSPDAVEICDGIDNDCDGAIDDADSDFQGGSTYYADVDLDGYGDASVAVDACDLPAGYSDNLDDCDDGNPAIYPGAAEIRDGVDNDCDSLIDDEDPISGNTYYADSDGDGYGDGDAVLIACELPESGYVDNSDDCDDGDESTNPDAVRSVVVVTITVTVWSTKKIPMSISPLRSSTMLTMMETAMAQPFLEQKRPALHPAAIMLSRVGTAMMAMQM